EAHSATLLASAGRLAGVMKEAGRRLEHDSPSSDVDQRDDVAHEGHHGVLPALLSDDEHVLGGQVVNVDDRTEVAPGTVLDAQVEELVAVPGLDLCGFSIGLGQQPGVTQ